MSGNLRRPEIKMAAKRVHLKASMFALMLAGLTVPVGAQLASSTIRTGAVTHLYGGVVAGASTSAVNATAKVQQTFSKDLRVLFSYSDSLRQCTMADPASECFAAFQAAVRDRM